MSHEAIIAAYTHEPDPSKYTYPPSPDEVVLAGVQVVCECGAVIMDEPGDDLGFLPLLDVSHAVRMHQEATREP